MVSCLKVATKEVETNNKKTPLQQQQQQYKMKNEHFLVKLYEWMERRWDKILQRDKRQTIWD